MPKLITIKGPTQGREYTLGDECLLGRSPNCQIYIGDLTVSRQHARIQKTDRGYIIEDLGSGNGTFINDRRVTQHLLQNSDTVRISNSVFQYNSNENQNGRWVSMVTVLSDLKEDLITVDTQAKFLLQQPPPSLSEKDLHAALTKSYRMLETLYAVTNATSSILEPNQLFNKTLDYLLNLFPNADHGFIMVLNETNQLIPVSVRQRKGSRTTANLTLSQAMVNQVLQEKKSVLSRRGTESGLLIPYRPAVSKMCAPLSAQAKTLGILHIEGTEQGKPFTQEDLDLLTGIASLVGVAFLNASLHQRLMNQQRLEQDLRFAKQVQQSILPLEPPITAEFTFSRRYKPLFDVGGDFYDFIPLPGNQLGVLIGDVSGKGVSAALLMARLTADMRYFAISEIDPTKVLSQANRSLIQSVQDNMFATVVYLVLDMDTGKMTYCNAGHIPPLLFRREENQVIELNQPTNLALGVLKEALFEQAVVDLLPGDNVLLCTDGVIETKNARKEEYGLKRLQRAFSMAHKTNTLEAILRDLLHFTGGSTPYDDITLVSFQRRDKNTSGEKPALP